MRLREGSGRIHGSEPDEGAGMRGERGCSGYTEVAPCAPCLHFALGVADPLWCRIEFRSACRSGFGAAEPVARTCRGRAGLLQRFPRSATAVIEGLSERARKWPASRISTPLLTS